MQSPPCAGAAHGPVAAESSSHDLIAQICARNKSRTAVLAAAHNVVAVVKTTGTASPEFVSRAAQAASRGRKALGAIRSSYVVRPDGTPLRQPPKFRSCRSDCRGWYIA